MAWPSSALATLLRFPESVSPRACSVVHVSAPFPTPLTPYSPPPPTAKSSDLIPLYADLARAEYETAHARESAAFVELWFNEEDKQRGFRRPRQIW